MTSSRPAFLVLHDHTLEETQEVEDFTIRFNMETSVQGSDPAERSFAFTLQEFISDSPTKEEFFHFLVEIIGQDEARSMLIDLVSLADELRGVFSSGFRGILTFFVKILVPSDELYNRVQGFRPASKAAIESLSRTRYEEQGGCEDQECSICLQALVVGERLASLPCVHQFHDGCVVKWLETSHVCPLCRFELPCEPETETRSEQGATSEWW